MLLITNNASAADCPKPIMPTQNEWLKWLSEVKAEASNLGISKEIINQELNDW